jgi:gamma-tubulin complex component 5
MAPTFEGDHWGKGYDEEIGDGWPDSASHTSHSDSEDEQVWTPNTDRIKKFGPVSRGREKDEVRMDEAAERMRDARAILERLGERAYWLQPSVEVGHIGEDVFGWRDLSTSKFQRRSDIDD